MPSNSPRTQNTYTIPGQDAGSLSEQADFNKRFQEITQSDEQLRTLLNANSVSEPKSQLEEPKHQVSDIANEASMIVGGDPLLLQFDQESSVDLATAAVHERIAHSANESQRAKERESIINYADRVNLFRQEHDIVSQVS